jgi:hypothetical protein
LRVLFEQSRNLHVLIIFLDDLLLSFFRVFSTFQIRIKFAKFLLSSDDSEY